MGLKSVPEEQGTGVFSVCENTTPETTRNRHNMPWVMRFFIGMNLI
jgi:hypothetical protein